MALNNIQKKLIRYDDASAAEKLVLDKISLAYVEGIADRDQTNANNSWNKMYKNVQISTFPWNKIGSLNGFSFIIPVRYGNMSQYCRLFGNDGISTTPISSYCIFGIYATATSMLFLASTYQGTATRLDYGLNIPWVSGMFDVIVVSSDMQNKQLKAYNPQTGAILTAAMPLAQSYLYPTTGTAAAQNFHLNGFNIFQEIQSISGMDTYGTYFIESALSDAEIVNARNHFYNIHKTSATKSFLQVRSTGLTDVILPEPTFEYKANVGTSTTAASLFYDKMYSTKDTTPFTAGKEMATGGGGAQDRRPKLAVNSWGTYTPLTVTDGDCELAGVTNWILENNTISNESKVAGSPGGTGTQVLRVNITGSGYARVIRDNATITGYPIAVLSKQLTHPVKISCWIRGARADAGISYLSALNVNEDQTTAAIPNQMPHKVPSDGAWHLLERDIMYSGNLYIGFTEARVAGDWFEVDDLKITRIDGVQVDGLVCDGYDDYIVSTNALKQVVDNSAIYTVAMAIDTTDTQINTRICSDYTGGNTSARIFDFYKTAATQYTIHNQPYPSASLTLQNFTMSNAKHIIVFERNVSTFNVWVDDVLVLTRSNLDTTTTTVSAATIGSFFNFGQSSRIKLGGFWGWNTAIATANHTGLFNKIKQMYPLT